MNLLAAIGRWLARPVCRFVEDVVAGHADERAEMRVRPPSVRVNDIGDVTIDVSEATIAALEAQFDDVEQARATGTYRLLDEFPGVSW